MKIKEVFILEEAFDDLNQGIAAGVTLPRQQAQVNILEA